MVCVRIAKKSPRLGILKTHLEKGFPLKKSVLKPELNPSKLGWSRFSGWLGLGDKSRASFPEAWLAIPSQLGLELSPGLATAGAWDGYG